MVAARVSERLRDRDDVLLQRDREADATAGRNVENAGDLGFERSLGDGMFHLGIEGLSIRGIDRGGKQVLGGALHVGHARPKGQQSLAPHVLLDIVELGSQRMADSVDGQVAAGIGSLEVF